MKKTACVLLMGGKSSRMGTDKAYLLYDGLPFWKRIEDEMKQCGPTYLSLDSMKRAPKTDSRIILDEYSAIGPIGGIYSGLLKAKEELVFFAPCDMPVLTADLIRAVLSQYTEECDGVILAGRDGKIYPTIGAYSKRILPVLLRRIEEKDYRLMGMVKEGKFKVVSVDQLEVPGVTLLNLNTWNEYQDFISRR